MFASCRGEREFNYVRVHELDQVEQMLGFTYELLQPASFENRAVRFEAEDVELISLSDSGEFVLCIGNTKIPFLWEVETDQIKIFELGNNNPSEIDFYGITDDGAAVGVVDHQRIVKFSIDKQPVEIDRTPKGFYASPGVNNTSSSILAGDWLLLYTANSKGNQKTPPDFAHRTEHQVWNLSNGTSFEARKFVTNQVSWFQVMGITAHGELLGTDFSSGYVIDRNKTIIASVHAEDYDQQGVAQFIAGNDKGMFVGMIEDYSTGSNRSIPFVWSSKSGFQLLSHDKDKYDTVGSFLINDNGLICAYQWPDSAAGRTKIWNANEPTRAPISINDAIKNRPDQYDFFDCYVLANDNSMLAKAYTNSNDTKLFLLRPVKPKPQDSQTD